MRLIIDGIIDHHSGWNWDRVQSISRIAKGVDADNYPLNTEAGLKDMWDELSDHMLAVFKTRSSLPIAVACKQKPTESVIDFWKRFKKCWTEEAGLNLQDHTNSLLISTFVSNLQPSIILTVKQTVSSWTSDTLPDFEKHLYEKEASGCFDIKKPAATSNTTHNFQGKGPPRKGGQPHGQGRGQYSNRNPPTHPGQHPPPQGPQRPKQTCCYNCHREGHWARDCPYPFSRPLNPHNTMPPPVLTTNQPRFNIDWQGQTH